MRRSIVPTTLAVLLVCLPGAVPVDEPPRAGARAEAARSDEATELAKAEANRFRMQLEAGTKGTPVLHPDALLRWSNPVAGSVHGSVFAWTERGCPVAVASIYKGFSPNTHLGVELHALSPTLASAERKGRLAWTPGRAAVERKAIPGSPKPAESAAGRLRQLRALAGEFSAIETTRTNDVRELRLLTQPIYRYQSADQEVIDGGLFAFVLGTDPEIILVIEARRTQGGAEWQFAAARMNSLSLTLNHKGREAWMRPTITWEEARDHRQPYSLFMFGSDPDMTFDGRLCLKVAERDKSLVCMTLPT